MSLHIPSLYLAYFLDKVYRLMVLCSQSTFGNRILSFAAEQRPEKKEKKRVSLAWLWVSVREHVCVSKPIPGSKSFEYESVCQHSTNEKFPLCVREASPVS